MSLNNPPSEEKLAAYMEQLEWANDNYSSLSAGAKMIHKGTIQMMRVMEQTAKRYPSLENGKMRKMVEAEMIKGISVNSCGNCKMCCIAPAIDAPSLDNHPNVSPKAAGVACSKLCSTGCSIYQNRPGICRGYLCLFISGQVNERPNDTGIAWTFQPDLVGDSYQIMTGHALDAYAAVKDRRNRKTIRAALELPYIGYVVIRSSATTFAFMKDGEVRQVDMFQTGLLDQVDVSTHRRGDVKHPLFDIDRVTA